jgi:hypothetical protein
VHTVGRYVPLDLDDVLRHLSSEYRMYLNTHHKLNIMFIILFNTFFVTGTTYFQKVFKKRVWTDFACFRKVVIWVASRDSDDSIFWLETTN